MRQSLNGCLSTRFVYDGANAVVEMNGSNEVVWAWVNGPGLDQPVERIAFINGEARNQQVIHADGLGSVSALTDESGETVQTYAYAAFGGIREQTGTDLNRVTFTAREALGDSLGLFYYRHRVYDPHTGRFTSEDPMGFIDGANRYVYVGNDPVDLVDPLGLWVNNNVWNSASVGSWPGSAQTVSSIQANTIAVSVNTALGDLGMPQPSGNVFPYEPEFAGVADPSFTHGWPSSTSFHSSQTISRESPVVPGSSYAVKYYEEPCGEQKAALTPPTGSFAHDVQAFRYYALGVNVNLEHAVDFLNNRNIPFYEYNVLPPK